MRSVKLAEIHLATYQLAMIHIEYSVLIDMNKRYLEDGYVTADGR